MTQYQFFDSSGDIVAGCQLAPLLARASLRCSLAEGEFPDHDSALAWAVDEDAHEEDLFRVEYLGPDGDWRWAGPLPV